LTGITEFILEKLGSCHTRLTGRVGSQEGAELAADTALGLLVRMRENLERLKQLVETDTV
jgi:hypothetical protein